MKILSRVIAVLCSRRTPVTGFMALFAGMAMDAPGSGKSTGKWMFVLSMMAAPFALLGAVIFCWKSIIAGDYARALGYCALGLIPFALAMLLLQFNWFEKK
ncbi:MAG: hypothetical protein L6Q97_24985 [Thermoanaerobaculia bacterium]|nr:hypothetical protein [Thermoanaerobaculia bacterium]